MAIDPSGGHPAMDYPEHLRTYSGFLKADRGPDRAGGVAAPVYAVSSGALVRHRQLLRFE